MCADALDYLLSTANRMRIPNNNPCNASLSVTVNPITLIKFVVTPTYPAITRRIRPITFNTQAEVFLGWGINLARKYPATAKIANTTTLFSVIKSPSQPPQSMGVFEKANSQTNCGLGCGFNDRGS